ncbi:OmcA/MtrC family decaheme c-type cytochrome [Geothrix sp. PMB-07]|uniref:OmcA/MtrC family decaheme c-type cytochrome n=1 Tax=Geothrix sp. PMB-07 TaxID=3068640 RepID=UPI0027416B25|nr:OmcA/MtrC family decaheme c-type cytochrome [Geothrix sp. PMB-07]WLT32070.1 OmcA/MtrC family decaheme c-type cytochrome [Geothrix sp. PMB-07]
MKHRPLKQLCGLLASAAIALVLIGCNGKAGQNGTNGTNGTPGTPGASYAADITTYSADDWAALTLKGTITKVTTGAQTVVNFTVTDGHNVPVKGFGQWTSKASTALYASYPNLGFSIAKLVPGTANSPDRWVNYIVTTVPTVAAPTAWNPTKPTTDNTGTLVDNGDGTYVYTFRHDITQATAQLAAYAYTGNNVQADLDDVSYQPTLTHRVTLYVGGVARNTGSALAGDRSFNTADGSDSGVGGVYILNPANDVYDFVPGTTGAGAELATSGKEITSVDKCFTCHAKFEFHAGGRQDTRYCVVCHTDQRKYGIKDATVTVTAGAAADHSQDTITTIVSGKSTESGKFRGRATGDFTSFIHRLHRGEDLAVTGYGYASLAFDATYPQDQRNCVKCHTNSTATPQGDNWFNKPSRMACGGCHDKIDFATGYGHWAGTGGAAAPQVDDTNCAGCHSAAYIKADHVPLVAPNPNNSWLVSGGNANTNASFVAAFPNALPAPAKYITWDLSSVTINASQQPVIKFRFMDSTPTLAATPGPAVPIVFNAQPAAADNTVELFTLPDGTQFVGGPSLYLSFAMPQDGIATPADPNATVSIYLRNAWNKTATAPGVATFTFDAASGYYTATLTGYKIPTNASLISGGIGYTYGLTSTQPLTQISNLSAGLPPWMTHMFDYIPKTAALGTGQGGLSVPPPNVWKVIASLPTGFPQTGVDSKNNPVGPANTPRRKIVDDAKCNACHGKLGVFTSKVFHAGQRNNSDTCVWCHNTDRVNSGWGVNIKDAVHAIHGAGKRMNKYSWEATAGDKYWNTTYPSPLNNCEICHVAGSYDFANALVGSTNGLPAVLPNLLWTTVATSDNVNLLPNSTTLNMAAGKAPVGYPALSATTYVIKTGNETVLPTDKVLSPFVTPGTDYGIGFIANYAAANVTAVTVQAAGTTLVNSPYVGACTGCHDSNVALDHMRAMGGSFYVTRSSVIDPATSTFDVKKQEQCFICHGSGKVADVQKVHMNFK